MQYTINDFFCGAGGVALGFLNAGFKVKWACDFDKHCVKTYRHNVGDWVVEADVTKLKYNDVPKADGWAFGFPCQDLSVAGQQAGFVFRCNDCGEEWKHESKAMKPMCPKCGSVNFSAVTRSACFFEIMRLLDETKANAPENYPTFLLAETSRDSDRIYPLSSRNSTAEALMFIFSSTIQSILMFRKIASGTTSWRSRKVTLRSLFRRNSTNTSRSSLLLLIKR